MATRPDTWHTCTVVFHSPSDNIVRFTLGPVPESRLATFGVGIPGSRIRTIIYRDDEPQHEFSVGLHDDTERQSFQDATEGEGELHVLMPGGALVRVRPGCIILELMLFDPESLDFYSDPTKRQILIDAIKDLLKEKRRLRGQPVDVVDGMVIKVSEEDIEETRKFFALGKEIQKRQS